MQAVYYSQARNNLRSLIDQVCDDYDEVMITTRDNKAAVLLSYDEYRSLQETMYLLSSRSNRERLLEAVEEIEKGDFRRVEIGE